MGKMLSHPELIKLFNDWIIADDDYEDNKGSEEMYEFAKIAKAAQKAFVKRRAELEAEGVSIWKE
jgi:hypothetical protein